MQYCSSLVSEISMLSDCGVCKFVSDKTASHRMSKEAYRAHLLGMCSAVMKSFMFNALVFFVGLTLGMGFTILNVQRVVKEKYQHDTVVRLQHALKKHNIDVKDVNDIVMQLKDEQVKLIGNSVKEAK